MANLIEGLVADTYNANSVEPEADLEIIVGTEVIDPSSDVVVEGPVIPTEGQIFPRGDGQ